MCFFPCTKFLLSNKNHHIGNKSKKNNTKYLHRTYAKQSSECSQHMNIFNPPNHPVKYAWLVSLFYTGENLWLHGD